MSLVNAHFLGTKGGGGALPFLLIIDKLVNTFEYFITKQFDYIVRD